MHNEASLAGPVLMAFGLLCVATLAYGAFRRSSVPFTVLLVLLGVGLRRLADVIPEMSWVASYQLEPEVVFFLLLPALIFESAYNLHARELVRNLVPILVLAVPALLISAVLIALGLWQWTGLSLPTAMIFGALISATDPVAVVALFKRLGAPHRLTVLVEGESLLNDGTALVFFKITLGVAIAGTVSTTTVFEGMRDFVLVSLGGAAVGVALAFPVTRLIRAFGGGPLIATSFTLITAYAGFILSEHYLGFSGVITTVTAALVLGTLAPTAIAPDARDDVHTFWELASYVCNSLLFLLLGLTLQVPSLWNSLGAVALAIALTLGARALIVYSMVPPLGRFFRLERVSLGYQTITFWGGLKGGLAVALALSLPHDLAGRETLVIITSGVVLFTLLVNATTIQPLMRALGLDEPERIERLEHRQAGEAIETAGRACLDELAEEKYLTLEAREDAARLLSGGEMDPHWNADAPTDDERRLLWLQRALWAEQEAYQELYEEGVIPELLTIDLKHEVARRQARVEQLEALPNAKVLTEDFQPRRASGLLHLERLLMRLLRRGEWLSGLLARLQRRRLTSEIEFLTASSLAYRRVCDSIMEEMSDPISEDVREFYMALDAKVRARLESLEHQFPHFVGTIQRRLAAVAAANVKLAELDRRHARGEISDKPYRHLRARLEADRERVWHERRRPLSMPERAPMLAKVPLFARLSQERLEELADRCKIVYYLEDDIVVKRGETGRCMFVIMSGEVEVLSEHGHRVTLLGAGDFFGEIALLRETPRNATVRAENPSALLQLWRQDVLALAEEDPTLHAILDEAAETRKPVTMMMPAMSKEQLAELAAAEAEGRAKSPAGAKDQ